MYKYKCIHEYTLYDNIDVKCVYRQNIYIVEYKFLSNCILFFFFKSHTS